MRRISSNSSPKKSSRTGKERFPGKTSMVPPRTQKLPGPSSWKASTYPRAIRARGMLSKSAIRSSADCDTSHPTAKSSGAGSEPGGGSLRAKARALATTTQSLPLERASRARIREAT